MIFKTKKKNDLRLQYILQKCQLIIGEIFKHFFQKTYFFRENAQHLYETTIALIDFLLALLLL